VYYKVCFLSSRFFLPCKGWFCWYPLTCRLYL